MLAAQRPADENARLASLYRSGLLEGVGEQRIRAITELASRMLKRPVAALSLITSDRQLLRAGVNLKLTSIPREESFCAFAILEPDRPLIVEDASQDPRFFDNPLVTARRLPVRFYAGVPVRTGDGQPVGTLCLWDQVPGAMTDTDATILQKLAAEIEVILQEHQGEPADVSNLLQDLRRALVDDELLLHWQPVADAQTTRTVSHEALVRWRRADGSMMRPDSFIPPAINSGLITRVDRFVLRNACTEAARQDGDSRVAVNISGRWFGLKRPALARVVSQTLSRTNLAPHRLTIELAEGVLARDPVRCLQEMRELKSLGVQLALDNFGTGYAALGYIETFPFDIFKLDESIVRELGSSPRAEAVAYGIIGLARELGKTVCAVGVETEQQLAFLREEGCNWVQGYLIGRPELRLR